MTSWSHKHRTYLTWRFDISFLIRSWETDKHTIIWPKNSIFNFSNLGNTTLTTTWNWTGWSCWRQSQGWTVSRLRGGGYLFSNFIWSFHMLSYLIFYQPILSFVILSPDDHHHDDEEEEGGGSQEAAEDDNAPKSTFKVDEIIPIVDSILEQDDKVSINRIHPNHPNCW